MNNTQTFKKMVNRNDEYSELKVNTKGSIISRNGDSNRTAGQHYEYSGTGSSAKKSGRKRNTSKSAFDEANISNQVSPLLEKDFKTLAKMKEGMQEMTVNVNHSLN